MEEKQTREKDGQNGVATQQLNAAQHQSRERKVEAKVALLVDALLPVGEDGQHTKDRTHEQSYDRHQYHLSQGTRERSKGRARQQAQPRREEKRRETGAYLIQPHLYDPIEPDLFADALARVRRRQEDEREVEERKRQAVIRSTLGLDQIPHVLRDVLLREFTYLFCFNSKKG
jgi:hypothetical protein